jgi:hypothetical protein
VVYTQALDDSFDRSGLDLLRVKEETPKLHKRDHDISFSVRTNFTEFFVPTGSGSD